MEIWERRLDHARKRAPKSLDFDALMRTHQARNDLLARRWRHDHPNSPYAVLQIRIFASGHTKRRLRRYREMQGFDTRAPGVLEYRGALTLEWLTLTTVVLAAAAARAEIPDIEWKLLTVAEALAPPP